MRVLGRLFVLALSLSTTAACGMLLGIETLGVDPADAAPAPPVADSELPPVDGAKPIVDSSTIPDAPDAATYKRVFLTSAMLETNGVINGVTEADKICARAATTAKLGGSWVAWLSGGGRNAIEQLTSDLPYRLLDFTPVVNNRTQLVSTGLLHPINVTEDGKVVSDPKPWVWTGTTNNGIASQHRCVSGNGDWTTSNPVTYGIAGSFDQTSKWTDNGGPGAGFPGFGCQTMARLYCFEK